MKPGSFMVGLAAAIALLAPASAQAAPGNDDYGAPVNIAGTLPQQVTGTNVAATKQSNEPDHADDPGGASVWYTWTAGFTGPVQIHTCNSPGVKLDTLLAVYTASGSVPPFTNLTKVASNDQDCGDGSLVQFGAVASTTYQIAVDGWSNDGAQTPAQGAFVLRVSTDIPTVQIDSGPSPVTADNTPTWAFSGTGTPAPLSFECYLFGVPSGDLLQVGVPCTSPVTALALANGNYLFAVFSRTATGEESDGAGWSFAVDVPSPPIAAPPAASNTLAPAKKCKKGQKRKRGRCVKKKKRKK